MSEILIDAISNVTVAAGLVRVDCVAVGPNNQQRPSGTLLIPGPRAGAVPGHLARRALARLGPFHCFIRALPVLI